MSASMSDVYRYPQYAYVRAPDQDAAAPVRHPVVVVGAGPVGLCAAVCLAVQGVPVVLLDDNNTVSTGSRAICFSKRTLEILDRLGVGQRLVDKGVTWSRGKVFSGERMIYAFDLLPEEGHRRPAFINLQQYYFEEFLIERAAAFATIDLRWRNRVTAISPDGDGVTLRVETPEGAYSLIADWVVACDGAHSDVRRMLGLDFPGTAFEDRFLIADVRMRADFPAERWFWFDPPFHPGNSALLHRQPDNVWRIDLQLGWDTDPQEEGRPERVVPRLRKMLGEGAEFDLDWISVYTFQCRRLEHFRHGRVLFAGDAAHQVSPFGARGANGGIQDIDNLVWKLKAVMDGRAPERLLDSYDAERTFAADENLRNSTRSTDFITPSGPAAKLYRHAVLELAQTCAFARRMVNSGRLSVPAILKDSPLNTPDDVAFGGNAPPGAVAPDAPVGRAGADGFLLDQLGGDFALLCFADGHTGLDAATADALQMVDGVRPVVVLLSPGERTGAAGDLPVVADVQGLAERRYHAKPGTVYLIRPDQHVAARWRTLDPGRVAAALARATGH